MNNILSSGLKSYKVVADAILLVCWRPKGLILVADLFLWTKVNPDAIGNLNVT